MSGAGPSGNKSVCMTSTCDCSPNRARLSRAHATERPSMSVATTLRTPWRARTAASTPVPVPDIKSNILSLRWRPRTKSIYSLRMGGKYSVPRMYAAIQRRNFYSVLAPFMSSYHSLQLTERHGEFFLPRAVDFQASLSYVWSTPQRNSVITRKRYEYHAEDPCPLTLSLTVSMKSFSHSAARPRTFSVDASGECSQQLACILEIASPE